MTNLEGQALGHYHLLRLIGRGGMGEVYLAEDEDRAANDPRHQVAIKVVRVADTTLVSDAEALRLFREGRFLTELRHPHILPVYHDGIRDDLLFLVMPNMPDGSLADAIQGRSRLTLTLPLPLERVVDYVGQIAEALQYTHDRHIVHRDVKPGNVLIDVEPHGHWHLLLADFGIARNLETTSREAQWHGTVAYMAPEQFRGEISPAADQYALGVLTFQLLSRQVPFGMQPPAVRTLNPAVPEAIEAVLLQALATHPEERFASVTAFAETLRAAASGSALTLPATSDPRHPSATRPRQRSEGREQHSARGGLALRGRRRRLILVVAGLILAIIAASGGIFLDARHLVAGSGRGTPPAGVAVIQGSVYIGGLESASNTTGPATIYAYRASDGKLRWHTSLPCPLVAPLAVGTGVVYAYTAPCNQGRGDLYALRSSNGAVVWVYPLAAPWRSTLFGGPYSPPADGPVPVVVNGVVYLTSANYGDTIESPNALGSIIAIDALSAAKGTPLWHVQMAGAGYAPAPVVVGSTLCLAILDASFNNTNLDIATRVTHIYGLRLDDGHTIWQDTVPTVGQSYSTYQSGDAGILYTAFSQIAPPVFASGLTAQRATDGSTLWRKTFPGYGVLVASNGTLFDLGLPDSLGNPVTPLYAVHASTATVLWQTGQYGSATAITVDSGKTYLGTDDGVIWALRASDGHAMWHERLSGASVLDLTATHGVVYVSSSGGYLDAFDAADGTRIWTARIAQQYPSRPAIGP